MLPSIRPKQTPLEHMQAPPDPGGTRRRRQPVQARRNTVVAVACQPCQRRKHKCDGERPTCTPCLARNRSDCAYDADGDQRRTSALKSRIETLSSQVQDLKDILTGIAAHPNSHHACATARQLAADGFLNTAEVAHALRTQQHRPSGAAEKRVRPQAEQKCGPLPLLQPGAIDPELLSSTLPIESTPTGADWDLSAPWLLEDRGDLQLRHADYGDIPIDPNIPAFSHTTSQMSAMATFAHTVHSQGSRHFGHLDDTVTETDPDAPSAAFRRQTRYIP